jgi:ribose/xylose/arabinose/galactoside ABC-type transport system permease subunit
LRRTLARLEATFGPFLGLLLIVGLFAYWTSESGTFLSAVNWRTIAVQSVIVGTAALGMTWIMIAGGIDLSVGSAVALVTVAITLVANGLRVPLPGLLAEGWGASVLEFPRIPLPLAMGAGIALGGLCGLANGWLITRLNLLPFIVTLGSMTILRGLATWLAGNKPIYLDAASRPSPDWSEQVLSINTTPLAPGVWILLGLSVFLALTLRYSLLGRYSYAVGSSEPTARLCGINVPGVKLAVYGLAGLLTGLAGAMQFLYLGGTGDPTTASGLELSVIAAVVIGGGSLSGGEGHVMGTLIGVLIISVLKNGCVHAGVPNAMQDVIVGVIIVAAVTIDRWRRAGRA